MKVSLNWIEEYLDFKLPETSEVIAKIDSQLGAIEEVIDLGKKYRGIVIVKVTDCRKHPDADKLSLCKIDDSAVVKDVKRDSQGLVQVVCGAPNVTAGKLYAWLPPGVVVPSSLDDEQPFKIDARDIRGVTSSGMLASAKELALGDSHEGLLELDEAAWGRKLKPGDDFAEVYKLNDTVVDIENKMFTHRPDCFGVLGVAREVAGIFNKSFKSPKDYKPVLRPASMDRVKGLAIKNELPEAVPRFVAYLLSSVEVKPSPVWLQTYLIRSGVRPINNVVDITNYVMLVTGQPLHAYDCDKVKNLSNDGPVLVVRHPKPGESLTLLNGKTITPRSNAIMIATDKRLIGVGGVMGGADTEVDDTTQSVILECANFDMYSIRRTAMAHGLFTDAVTRFSKHQSPLQNRRVASMAAQMIERIARAKIKEVIDNNHVSRETLKLDSPHPPVSVKLDFINKRLGSNLSLKEAASLLTNVEFSVSHKRDNLVVEAPFWRTDISLPEDVVEEVGRLHGYDKLPLVLPKRDLSPAPKDPLLSAKAVIRGRLAQAGASEVLSYSFVNGDLLDKSGQDSTKAIKLANALSPELQYYRLSLLPSLLEKVHLNIKAGHDQFALFELGKNHALDQPTENNDLPVEYEFTALVLATADKLKPAGSAYYLARQYLEALTKTGLEFKPINDAMRSFPVAAPYAPNRSAGVYIKGVQEFLGLIGEIKPDVARALKLPKYCAGFELDTRTLAKLISQPDKYTPLSNYPWLNQDITLSLLKTTSFQKANEALNQTIKTHLPGDSTFVVTPKDIFVKAKAKQQNITWRVSLASYKRTLTDKEVNLLLDKVAATLTTKLGAERA